MFVTLIESATAAEEVGVSAVRIAAIIAAAWLLGWIQRPLLSRLLRTLARRGLAGKPTRWALRVPRLFGETRETSELRREQRIDASAAAVGRIFSLMIWIFAVLIILDELKINAAIALGGAGFLGAGLAVGGQHTVNDFLTGLQILFGDRFGEGDTIETLVYGAPMTGIVHQVGAFSTVLSTDDAMVHVANRDLGTVINRSQRGAAAEITLRLQGTAHKERLRGQRSHLDERLRLALAETTSYDAAKDGLVVDRLEFRDEEAVIWIRTARKLSEAQVQALLDSLSPTSLARD